MEPTTTPTRKKLHRFDSPEQEVYLAMWRTYDRLQAIEDEVFKPYGITAQQYNLLRLLRSSYPESVPTSSLIVRLVSRAPDVTRMLDRLEQHGYIQRERSTEDRRAVLVSITRAGLELLTNLAEPIKACHQRQLGHLSEKQLKQLETLLRLARRPHETDDSPWK